MKNTWLKLPGVSGGIFKVWREFGHALHQVLLLRQVERRHALRARHRVHRVGVTGGDFLRVLWCRPDNEGLLVPTTGNNEL